MPVEAIAPVGSVSEVAAAAVTALHAHASPLAAEPPTPSQAALADAQAVAGETDQQLADDGDPLAIDRVSQDQDRLTPVSAQHLQPAHVSHAAGATEPGKGALIDVYD